MLRKILTILKKCVIVPRHQMIQATLEREIDEKTGVEYISSKSVNQRTGKEKTSRVKVFNQAKIRANRRKSGMY